MASSARQITTQLEHFNRLIDDWDAKNPQANELSFAPIVSAGDQREGKDVVVAFRTRPPLDREFGRFATEIASVDNADGDVNMPSADAEKLKAGYKPGIVIESAEPGVMVAHVPAMKWNGATLAQKRFTADMAFGPSLTNEEIYQRIVAAHDMLNLVLGGGVACMMAYGQTGAGKTYTMESMERFIAKDLFTAAELFARRFAEPGETKAAEDILEFRVTFLELLGKTATDLSETSEDGGRKTVDIFEDKVGNVKPKLTEKVVRNGTELLELIGTSLSHRRTEATLKNATSSRSHAVLTIRVHNKALPFADDGEFILVDLAGSERYDDSKAHSKELMDQSRENNKSLLNLKECVRTRAKAATEDGVVHIPFRSNKLTLLLKAIFDLESRRLSKTVVIAHVSPHLQDIAHSINTLSYASPFLVNVPKQRGLVQLKKDDPRTWDHAFTLSWLAAELEIIARRKRRAEHRVAVKQASHHGKKKVPNLDETQPVKLAFDPLVFCPEGCAGKNLGKLYAAEWMERCVKAADLNSEKGKERGLTKREVEDIGFDIYGTFTVMLLKARARTRNTVLKSRNTLSNETWGDVPADATSRMAKARASKMWNDDDTTINWDITDAQWAFFEKAHGKELQDGLEEISAEAKERGEDPTDGQAKFRKRLWEDWQTEVQKNHFDELTAALGKVKIRAKKRHEDENTAIFAESHRLMGSWLAGENPEPLALSDEEAEKI